MDYVNDFFARHPTPIRPQIKTKRGDALSVQAGSAHYSTPRSDTGPYSAVEVWWPRECPKPLRKYKREGDTGPLGWVPVEAVNSWIANRGGLAN